jgi:hypothetical protein
MKALSVRQPWASQILTGAKWLEIRSWKTAYRGSLLICVSRRPRLANLPSGVALCIVDLRDCRPMTAADEPGSGVQAAPGLFAWVLGHCRSIEPFAVSGRLGLFEVDVPSQHAPNALGRQPMS